MYKLKQAGKIAHDQLKLSSNHMVIAKQKIHQDSGHAIQENIFHAYCGQFQSKIRKERGRYASHEHLEK